MSKPLKLAIGVSVSLAIIAVAVFFFLRYLLIKSFPITEGIIPVSGIQSPVHIFRDELGVPHILADDERAMFFAIGYVHAQDRLWQMDLVRRTGQGRLSEIFGAAAVEFDKLFRTIDLARTADTLAERLHPESKRALEAYALGVNAFIADNETRLPVEFDMLNYKPDLWEPRHSLIVARMMAWELNLASMADLPLGLIAARVGADRAIELVPPWPSDAPTTVRSPRATTSREEQTPIDLSALEVLKNATQPRWFITVNRMYREQAGNQGQSGGSNCWVVGASRSASGKPILANDIHLPMSAPARWYQLHCSCGKPGSARMPEQDSSQFDVAGLTVPGAPFVILGRNKHIAWGITNMMVDDADFFIEQVDSTSSSYLFNGNWRPIRSREELIYIGKSDSAIVWVRRTHHGPIVDEFERRDSVGRLVGRYAVSMRWTGFDVSDEPYGFYLINRARDSEEFEVGVSAVTVPGLGMVCAETTGSIGYWSASRIPKRGTANPMFPLAGWTGQNEWQGYVPFPELPRLSNPPEDYIATANNKIVGSEYPYYISDLWEPPSRIQRIHELHDSREAPSIEDFERFQMDITSPFSKQLAGAIIEAIKSASQTDPEMKAVLEYLRNWDFRYGKDDIVSMIVDASFVKLVHNTFADELGDSLLYFYTSVSAMPYRAVGSLLEKDSSAWFDDIRTPQVESRDDILLTSVRDAINTLREKFGPDMKSWRWGLEHTVTFEHPLGKRRPLDRVFNIGPFPVGGSATTINKADFRIRLPYSTVVGPSIRQVIDLSNASGFWSVITTGQSGQPLHKHYDDQTVLWLNGSYHWISLDWNSIRNSNWEHLELRPASENNERN